MPRRKKLPEETNDPIYGVWIPSTKYNDERWLIDGNGNIISSDFLGIIKAQAKRMNKEGLFCSVKIVGDDGEPIEMES